MLADILKQKSPVKYKSNKTYINLFTYYLIYSKSQFTNKSFFFHTSHLSHFYNYTKGKGNFLSPLKEFLLYDFYFFLSQLTIKLIGGKMTLKIGTPTHNLYNIGWTISRYSSTAHSCCRICRHFSITIASQTQYNRTIQFQYYCFTIGYQTQL